MKVIIAGGREITDKELVHTAVASAGFTITEVVSGGARGVDVMGETWGKKNGIPVRIFWAEWTKYGKKAGYLRNQQMAQYADALIAIPGKGPGTRNMIQCMEKLKKPLFVLERKP